jgi:hypothetical protein
VTLEACPLLISIAILPEMGMLNSSFCLCFTLTLPIRILEYLSRDDADRAVKELDGKDLRGRPVRVMLDDSVG